ncbi:MAG: flagellar filament capping protein FliD [Lachnospiraceae bacterium]|nr:flagellar filament capping protein FliD [Lachnospiraceae bacterium]
MSDKMRMSGLISGMDTDSVIEALVSNKKQKVTTAKNDQKKLEWKQTIYDGINTNIKSLFQSHISNMRFSSSYSKMKTSVSNTSVASVVTGDGAVNATQKLRVKQLAKSAYLTGKDLNGESKDKTFTASSKLSDLGFTGEGDTISLSIGGKAQDSLTVTGETTISDVLTYLKGAGLNASFDEETQRFFVSAKSTGASKDFTLSDGGNGALSALGLQVATDSQKNATGFNQTQYASKIDGSDAEIYLNDAKFTGDTNTFKINGLTITALDETGDKEITLTTSTDTSGIYDMIKNMISQYNKTINEIDKYYNADSARKYSMLTDEQKEAMKDKEVEEYENKIKSSLLRSDSNLASLRNLFSESLSSGIEIGDKTYHLSDFGIGTGSYFNTADNEKHALHIDGDPDDSLVKDKTDKLSELIASDPELVTQFFSKLSQDLYSKLDGVSKSVTGYRSYGSFYDDKKMKSDYDGFNKTIKDLEQKANDYEDKLYRQFSSMETALANLQKKSSALAGLLGTGS